MGVQERKAREREELRQEILDAARQLFVEQGYDAVSMRKIADRIEYSPTTIYLHFRDKSDLLDCICADTFRKLINRLQSIAEEPVDPVDRLRKGLRAYVDFGLENPADYRVTFMMPHAVRSRNEEAECRSEEAGQCAFGSLVARVAECVATGRLRVNNVEAVSQILWSGVHGVTSLLITHPEFPWVERDALIDEVIDTLVRGLEQK